MTNPSSIEHVVMRRVRTIRVLRGVFSGAMVCTLVLVICIFAISREVWVARVFENAPANLSEAWQFWLYAFEHTRFVVQALALTTLASVVYLARATARLVSGALTPVRA